MAGTKEGARKSKNAKNPYAPRGKHWCYMHPDKSDKKVGAYLPFKEFNKNRANMHGLSDRCRDCEKRYREEYEALHGKRNQVTKTLRVQPDTHRMVKLLSRRSGAAIYEYISAAVKFYAMYGCQYPGCTRPRSRFGKCRDHMTSVRMKDIA